MGSRGRAPGPPLLMYAVAHVCERLYAWFGWPRPLLTVMEVTSCVNDTWFDIGRARAELGYEPLVTVAEGRALCVDHVRALMAGEA